MFSISPIFPDSVVLPLGAGPLVPIGNDDRENNATFYNGGDCIIAHYDHPIELHDQSLANTSMEAYDTGLEDYALATQVELSSDSQSLALNLASYGDPYFVGQAWRINQVDTPASFESLAPPAVKIPESGTIKASTPIEVVDAGWDNGRMVITFNKPIWYCSGVSSGTAMRALDATQTILYYPTEVAITNGGYTASILFDAIDSEADNYFLLSSEDGILPLQCLDPSGTVGDRNILIPHV